MPRRSWPLFGHAATAVLSAYGPLCIRPFQVLARLKRGDDVVLVEDAVRVPIACREVSRLTRSAIIYLSDSVAINLFQASAGDANGDRQFDQRDITELLDASTYLTDQPAAWTQGDFNGDGRFDQRDIVDALQKGEYLGATDATSTP